MGSQDSQFQQIITGSFTATSQTKDLTSPNQGTSVIQITGTWSGTIVLEGSNTTTFLTIPVLNTSTNLFQNSITTNGIYLAPTNGYQNVQLRTSAWTSGTATINVYGSDALSVINSIAQLRGATDGTLIGNNGDKLKVDANLSSGQLVPTITNKLRVRYAISNVTLPSSNVFQTIYSRSGTGLFFGAQLGFNHSNVTIRLTIDGGQVFSLPLSDIKSFEFNDTTDGRVQMGGFLTAVGNVFDFSSRYSIPYSSSVLVEAASNDGANHTLQKYMVIQTEDT